MPARIGSRRPYRIFLVEWREWRGLTQEALANRLGVTGTTVSRWERSTALLNTKVMGAVAEALDIDPPDLYRHPNQPSADALLRGQPVEIREQAIAVIEALRKARH
jgi:transcriptional regulator with XRE-family HTH domain